MSVAPNLCCDETKNQGTYTRVTFPMWNLGTELRVGVSNQMGEYGLTNQWFSMWNYGFQSNGELTQKIDEEFDEKRL